MSKAADLLEQPHAVARARPEDVYRDYRAECFKVLDGWQEGPTGDIAEVSGPMATSAIEWFATAQLEGYAPIDLDGLQREFFGTGAGRGESARLNREGLG